MRAPFSLSFVLLGAVCLSAAALACAPKRDIPVEQIPKVASLEELMDVQATVADPQFKKIDAASYGDADWAAFTDAGSRIQATSTKAKEFSKGPGFDALADRLNEKAKALSAAAAAKDQKAASLALTEMRATCKECHSQFK